MSDILSYISQLGYKAHPYNARRREETFENERKTRLLQLAIAGLFGMQVMMIAIATYFGDAYGIEQQHRVFFNWVSLVLTLPVLGYSGKSIWQGAIRDIAVRRPGMDIPITIGISIAFIGSLHATIMQHGHVYYDSIVMFIFFILAGRYFEFTSRKKSVAHLDRIASLLPIYASRMNDSGETELVLVNELQVGDRVMVKPGEVIPVDGIVYDGESSVNESIITGESLPVRKEPGMQVVGGSANVESPLYIETRLIGENTFLSHVSRLIEKASQQKAQTLLLANRIVSVFIIFILVVAGLVAIYWYHTDPDQWLAITVAVLVVTCPCALSLAMPTALSAASATLMKHGLAIVNHDAIELIANADCFVFDKTGTLTEGMLTLNYIDVRDQSLAEDDVYRFAIALEQVSEHPVARAICHAQPDFKIPVATDIKNLPGQGITGIIDNQHWYIGSTSFIRQQGIEVDDNTESASKDLKRVFLANHDHVAASFYINDPIRSASKRLVEFLGQSGKRVILLSGDQDTIVKQVAYELGINDVESELRPDDKLAYIEALQAEGHKVCMIGDGINDAPAFAKADVAIAMTGASDITSLNADMLLLNNQIDTIRTMLGIVNKTSRTIHVNFSWAIGYNLVALPVAVLGFLSPWMAALGMSLSSLIVVLNATRISMTRYT